jgi:hypothetical protein
VLPLQVIVPIHQGVHWALGVINLRDRQLEYFDSVCDGDSYPFSKKADPETVLEDLVSLIHAVVLLTCGEVEKNDCLHSFDRSHLRLCFEMLTTVVA